VAYELLAEYPKLTCVLCDTGVWGSDRFYRPLVERYHRVFLDTSMVGIGDGLLESLCRDYGAHRLLYGSGFPERVPEAAMLSLLHAELSDTDVVAIASQNARRLLEEAELD
jgi:predicted TIM-barrel fold metal-dependent hydrolase